MDVVKRSQVGAGVAVKIEHAVYESAKLFGRHFNGMWRVSGIEAAWSLTCFTLLEHDELVSLISRTSIDALKTHFKEQVDKDDWVLIAKKLKPLLDIA
jgi:translation initiation factor 5B